MPLTGRAAEPGWLLGRCSRTALSHGARGIVNTAFAIAPAAMILAGCAGIADRLGQIRGVAPDDGSCSIVVLEAGTQRVLSSQRVQGRFSVGFGLGDEYPRKVDVTGACNGKTVKFFGGIVPGTIGVTELGTVAP